MTNINIFIFILIIILLIILIITFINSNIESFGDFSPYIGNQAYPYVYQKHADQKALRQTLKNWEKPFNYNNEGYYNAEPKGLPPLSPIVSFY